MNKHAADGSKACARLRATREVLGMTQEEFAQLIGIEYTRYRNIDICRARLTDEVYPQLYAAIPEFFLWVAVSGPVDVLRLEQHSDHRFVSAAIKLKMGQAPALFAQVLAQVVTSGDAQES